MVLPYDQVWYLTSERRLDMGKLLAAFQQFFREHADAWLERFDYKEAGPQLLLQAFLQRVVGDLLDFIQRRTRTPPGQVAA